VEKYDAGAKDARFVKNVTSESGMPLCEISHHGLNCSAFGRYFSRTAGERAQDRRQLDAHAQSG
jgi:hypothetical protein